MRSLPAVVLLLPAVADGEAPGLGMSVAVGIGFHNK